MEAPAELPAIPADRDSLAHPGPRQRFPRRRWGGTNRICGLAVERALHYTMAMPAVWSSPEPMVAQRWPVEPTTTAGRQALLPLLLLAGLTMTACTDDDSGSGWVVATHLVVDPARFLGDVPCSSNDGAMRSYVVTLSMWEGLGDSAPFVLGSSHPTPCTRQVAFQDVLTPGRLYTAEIDGYLEYAADLRPFGEVTSGARRMHRADTQEIVEPRWATRCGYGPATATLALESEGRIVEHCAPLEGAGMSTTAIAFPPAAALGADPCTTAATLDVTPLDSALPAVSGLACDAEPILFDQAIEPRQAYHFYATADADGVTVGTECYAVAQAGEQVRAKCNAISETGDIRIDLQALPDGADICPAGFWFDVELDGEVLNAVPLACEAQAVVGPFPPTDYALDVIVYDAVGELFEPGASCTATVEPGRVATASCAP